MSWCPHSYPQLYPFVQEPPVVKFTQESGLGDCKGRVTHLSSATCHITEVIIPLFAKNRWSSHEWNGFFVLWPRVFEIPELDMAVSGCHKVVAIFSERDGFDFGGDLESIFWGKKTCDFPKKLLEKILPYWRQLWRCSSNPKHWRSCHAETRPKQYTCHSEQKPWKIVNDKLKFNWPKNYFINNEHYLFNMF